VIVDDAAAVSGDATLLKNSVLGAAEMVALLRAA
jgi:hypothetical protein